MCVMYNRVRGVVPATAGRVAMGYTGEQMERGAATARGVLLYRTVRRDDCRSGARGGEADIMCWERGRVCGRHRVPDGARERGGRHSMQEQGKWKRGGAAQ